MQGRNLIEEVRAAVDRGEWQAALDALATVDSDTDAAQAAELRATAAYGNGDLEASVTAWEELYALRVAEGDRVDAARAAAMIAMYLMIDTGLMAPVRSWLRRAEELCGGQPEAPARALIALVRTYERFMCGDMSEARRQSALAVELGEQLGVQPAVVIGRVAAARTEILDGSLDEGLRLLDDVARLLMTGEVDALTTGMMYCELICAAQGLALHDKAEEWTQLMERWRHGAAFGGINGRCRVHRAELLRTTGPCDLAEQEALGACDELRPWMRREFGWPLAELGNIRLRKGDLEGAEEAFIAAHEHAWSAQPGLALVRLAQGDVDGAAALIQDAIAHPVEIPSKERPPFGDLRLAPLLDAQVEIAAERRDASTAGRAAASLRAIANAYPSGFLRASASLAEARLALLDSDTDSAIDACNSAIVSWSEIGAPFEIAKARIVLGNAHDRSGNHDLAFIEWRAARDAFSAFGAALWAERAAELIGDVPRALLAPPRAQVATFMRDGSMRSVSFAGLTVHLRDLKGMRYLERLLSDPDREFHVLDLVAVERGSLPTGPSRLASDTQVVGDDALPVIDDQARKAYRRRLAEVDDDIAEATSLNDLGRLELAQRDRDYLVAELARSVGIAGRHRSTGSTAEKARTSVTRSIRYAIARLAEIHPSLAAHLENTVRTGTYCRYVSDPLVAITWNV